MASLLSEVSSAVAACATRRLFRARRLCQGGGLEWQHAAAAQGGSDGTGVGEDGEGLWRRAILMGERFEPLDFTVAIHCDSFGRRIAQPGDKGRRSPSDEAVRASKKARYVALVQN